MFDFIGLKHLWTDKALCNTKILFLYRNTISILTMKKYKLKKFEKKSPIEVIFNLIDLKHPSVHREGVVQH